MGVQARLRCLHMRRGCGRNHEGMWPGGDNMPFIEAEVRHGEGGESTPLGAGGGSWIG